MTDRPDKNTAVYSPRVAVVVCERDGIWAALLDRELDTSLAVRETRTPGECLDVVTTFAGGVVVCELTEAHLNDTLALMMNLNLRFPAFRIVVVTTGKFAHLEPLVRELGAIHVITSPRKLPVLADLIPRHLARLHFPSQSMTQRFWGNLPWPEAESSKFEVPDPM